jgi:hypothetical protein
MQGYWWLLFVLGTVLCWGAYGPTIHAGNIGLGSPWKTLLCVGAAYFALGVIVPVVVLSMQGVGFGFSGAGTLFGLLGGALGALGAACVIGALQSGGKPVVVMPLVFGCAPVVNVVVSSIQHPPKGTTSPFLYLGVLLLGCGAGLVLYFKPQ